VLFALHLPPPSPFAEGRLNADVLAFLVKSAASAGFNTFRVWGGGIFLPDVFYDTGECGCFVVIITHIAALC